MNRRGGRGRGGRRRDRKKCEMRVERSDGQIRQMERSGGRRAYEGCER